MRCLTANYLESHREYFEPFCQIPYKQLIENVLLMGKEADGLGIGPLQVILFVKIEIITIDRNYEEALSFEQMKIAGKCPLIYILYKPGHYDIIYSIDQSNADGFDQVNEKYTQQFKVPQGYQIGHPETPFFIEIQKTEEESPREEFKQFQIKYDFPYMSTEKRGIDFQKQIEPQQATQILECTICHMELEQQFFTELSCRHQICNPCLGDWIETKTGGRIIVNNNESGQRATCQYCGRQLTSQEIEKIVGQEKFKDAQIKAEARLRK